MIFTFLHNLSENIFILTFGIKMFQGSKFYIRFIFILRLEGVALCFVTVEMFNAIVILDSLCMALPLFLSFSVSRTFFCLRCFKFQSYAIMWGDFFVFYLCSGFLVDSFRKCMFSSLRTFLELIL